MEQERTTLPSPKNSSRQETSAIPEDIDLHRHIMGIPPLQKKTRKDSLCRKYSPLSCPPHLASQLDNRPIDFGKIKRATEELSERYDYVLLEGAGGLHGSINYGTSDNRLHCPRELSSYFCYPGNWEASITPLLSLEAIQKRDIVLDTVLYNMYPTPKDKTIQNDTMNFIQNWLKKYFPNTKFILIPEIKDL